MVQQPKHFASVFPYGFMIYHEVLRFHRNDLRQHIAVWVHEGIASKELGGLRFGKGR